MPSDITYEDHVLIVLGLRLVASSIGMSYAVQNSSVVRAITVCAVVGWPYESLIWQISSTIGIIKPGGQ